MCRVGINPGTIVHQLAKTKAGLGGLYIGRVRAECDGVCFGAILHRQANGRRDKIYWTVLIIM